MKSEFIYKKYDNEYILTLINNYSIWQSCNAIALLLNIDYLHLVFLIKRNGGILFRERCIFKDEKNINIAIDYLNSILIMRELEV